MKHNGFSMTEMMVATGIFLMVAVILSAVLIAGKNSWDVGSTYMELQQQARTAMASVVQEISESNAVLVDRFLCGSGSGCNGEYIEYQVPVIDNNIPYQDSIYRPDGTIKWGADGFIGNKVRIAAVNGEFDIAYDGKLVRLADPPPNPTAYCGDGACNYLETCTNCSTDCGSCPPEPPCFLAGTAISMADGSTKMIEDIKIGDVVLAFDRETGKLMPDAVKEVEVHRTDKYLIINRHLKVTPNHPFYVNGKTIPIGEMKIGDVLLAKNGKIEKISSIQEINKETTVYNIIVNPYHTFIADGYVATDKGGDAGQTITSNKTHPILALLDKFRYLGLAFAGGGGGGGTHTQNDLPADDDGSPPPNDPAGTLGSPGDYDIKVISDNINLFEVKRRAGNPYPNDPYTLVLIVHASKTTTGGMPVEVVLSSQVTFKNSPPTTE
jgi:type II secretory pathway pseudopilin PulG